MKRLLVWVLCLLLTGCGGKQLSDWSAFIPEEEKRLVIYTSHPRSVYEPVIKEFEERTGLWVQVETGGTAELLERLEVLRSLTAQGSWRRKGIGRCATCSLAAGRTA